MQSQTKVDSTNKTSTNGISSEAVLPLSECPEPVCVACLGVLQSQFSTAEFIDSIHAAIVSLKLEFTTFLCSISMPVSMLVRDHGIYLMMKQLNPGIYSTSGSKDVNKYMSIASVKDVWKWINGPAIASKLNVNFDQSSLFEV